MVLLSVAARDLMGVAPEMTDTRICLPCAGVTKIDGASLGPRCATVRHLLLQGNELTSLSGIEFLPELRTVSLAGNPLERVSEVERLRGHRHLTNLVLEGCPLTRDPNYRRSVIKALGPRDRPLRVDGKLVTEEEVEDVSDEQLVSKTFVPLLLWLSRVRDTIEGEGASRVPPTRWRFPNPARRAPCAAVTRPGELLTEMAECFTPPPLSMCTAVRLADGRELHLPSSALFSRREVRMLTAELHSFLLSTVGPRPGEVTVSDGFAAAECLPHLRSMLTNAHNALQVAVQYRAAALVTPLEQPPSIEKSLLALLHTGRRNVKDLVSRHEQRLQRSPAEEEQPRAGGTPPPASSPTEQGKLDTATQTTTTTTTRDIPLLPLLKTRRPVGPPPTTDPDCLTNAEADELVIDLPDSHPKPRPPTPEPLDEGIFALRERASEGLPPPSLPRHPPCGPVKLHHRLPSPRTPPTPSLRVCRTPLHTQPSPPRPTGPLTTPPPPKAPIEDADGSPWAGDPTPPPSPPSPELAPSPPPTPPLEVPSKKAPPEPPSKPQVVLSEGPSGPPSGVPSKAPPEVPVKVSVGQPSPVALDVSREGQVRLPSQRPQPRKAPRPVLCGTGFQMYHPQADSTQSTAALRPVVSQQEQPPPPIHPVSSGAETIPHDNLPQRYPTASPNDLAGTAWPGKAEPPPGALPSDALPRDSLGTHEARPSTHHDPVPDDPRRVLLGEGDEATGVAESPSPPTATTASQRGCPVLSDRAEGQPPMGLPSIPHGAPDSPLSAFRLHSFTPPALQPLLPSEAPLHSTTSTPSKSSLAKTHESVPERISSTQSASSGVESQSPDLRSPGVVPRPAPSDLSSTAEKARTASDRPPLSDLEWSGESAQELFQPSEIQTASVLMSASVTQSSSGQHSESELSEPSTRGVVPTSALLVQSVLKRTPTEVESTSEHPVPVELSRPSEIQTASLLTSAAVAAEGMSVTRSSSELHSASELSEPFSEGRVPTVMKRTPAKMESTSEYPVPVELSRPSEIQTASLLTSAAVSAAVAAEGMSVTRSSSELHSASELSEPFSEGRDPTVMKRTPAKMESTSEYPAPVELSRPSEIHTASLLTSAVVLAAVAAEGMSVTRSSSELHSASEMSEEPGATNLPPHVHTEHLPQSAHQHHHWSASEVLAKESQLLPPSELQTASELTSRALAVAEGKLEVHQPSSLHTASLLSDTCSLHSQPQRRPTAVGISTLPSDTQLPSTSMPSSSHAASPPVPPSPPSVCATMLSHEGSSTQRLPSVSAVSPPSCDPSSLTDHPLHLLPGSSSDPATHPALDLRSATDMLTELHLLLRHSNPAKLHRKAAKRGAVAAALATALCSTLPGRPLCLYQPVPIPAPVVRAASTFPRRGSPEYLRAAFWELVSSGPPPGTATGFVEHAAVLLRQTLVGQLVAAGVVTIRNAAGIRDLVEQEDCAFREALKARYLKRAHHALPKVLSIPAYDSLVAAKSRRELLVIQAEGEAIRAALWGASSNLKAFAQMEYRERIERMKEERRRPLQELSGNSDRRAVRKTVKRAKTPWPSDRIYLCLLFSRWKRRWAQRVADQAERQHPRTKVPQTTPSQKAKAHPPPPPLNLHRAVDRATTVHRMGGILDIQYRGL